MVGDHFLVRGYEDGKHFAAREKFYPTLFVDSKRKTKYKTLDGLPVEPIEPGTVRDCREFIKKSIIIKLYSWTHKVIQINTQNFHEVNSVYLSITVPVGSAIVNISSERIINSV